MRIIRIGLGLHVFLKFEPLHDLTDGLTAVMIRYFIRSASLKSAEHEYVNSNNIPL